MAIDNNATWTARQNIHTQVVEVCQNGNVVAITQDPRWAMMVCDLLDSHHRDQIRQQKEATTMAVDDEGDGPFNAAEHRRQKEARLKRLHEGDDEE